MKGLTTAHWSDLATPQKEYLKNQVDQDYLLGKCLSVDQHLFASQGFLIKRNFLPHDLIREYDVDREITLTKDRSKRDNFFDGWHYPTPYMDNTALRKLATYGPMCEKAAELIGEDVGLHLCLTGYVSTERDWHQDTYLNPDWLGSNYLAVWMALDDVDPMAGPFEYIPTSNTWEVLQRSKLFEYLAPAEQSSPHWPTTTQAEVARVCEERFGNAVPQQALLKKGDVLYWHSNLIHRGSVPKNKSLLRKALICHYSSLKHRKDMGVYKRNSFTSGYYFVLPSAGEVRP